jgi:hypothetical protein
MGERTRSDSEVERVHRGLETQALEEDLELQPALVSIFLDGMANHKVIKCLTYTDSDGIIYCIKQSQGEWWND